MKNFYVSFCLILLSISNDVCAENRPTYRPQKSNPARRQSLTPLHRERRRPAENEGESPVFAPKRSSDYFSISGQLLSMYYAEKFPTPPNDTENGVLPGVHVELQKDYAHDWAFRVLGDFVYGNTMYVGALQDGTPLTSTTNDTILDLRGSVGYSIATGATSKIAPYLGLGVHYWKRNLTGTGSYPEGYLFFYLPVGLRFEMPLSEAFDLALDGSVFVSFAGTIQAGLSHLIPPSQDASGTLGSSFGYRLSATGSYWVSETVRLTLEPFVEYFGIGQGGDFTIYSQAGAVQGSANEPPSLTYFYGGNLGAAFHF